MAPLVFAKAGKQLASTHEGPSAGRMRSNPRFRTASPSRSFSLALVASIRSGSSMASTTAIFDRAPSAPNTVNAGQSTEFARQMEVSNRFFVIDFRSDATSSNAGCPPSPATADSRLASASRAPTEQGKCHRKRRQDRRKRAWKGGFVARPGPSLSMLSTVVSPRCQPLTVGRRPPCVSGARAINAWAVTSARSQG